MNWVPLAVVCALTLLIASALFVYRRRNRGIPSDIKISLKPAVRIASFDGWASLELHIENRSDATVWLEEAALVITDLDANFQTALAIGQTTHRIRQAVRPNETLSMSIAASLYEAAGRPQGSYSFLVLGTVHYRIGEVWAEANILPYGIEMAALSVLHLRRIRGKQTPAEADRSHKVIGGRETAKVKSAGQ